jgi:hypothetical protein
VVNPSSKQPFLPTSLFNANFTVGSGLFNPLLIPKMVFGVLSLVSLDALGLIIRIRLGIVVFYTKSLIRRRSLHSPTRLT